jgi:hypothetical protein
MPVQARFLKTHVFAMFAAATLVAPAAFAVPADPVGKVTAVTGDAGKVLVKRGSTIYSLGLNADIFEGDEVYTREGSSVAFSNSLCVGSQSEALGALKRVVVDRDCAAVLDLAETAQPAATGGGIGLGAIGATPLLILPVAALAALAGGGGGGGGSPASP